MPGTLLKTTPTTLGTGGPRVDGAQPTGWDIGRVWVGNQGRLVPICWCWDREKFHVKIWKDPEKKQDAEPYTTIDHQ